MSVCECSCGQISLSSMFLTIRMVIDPKRIPTNLPQYRTIEDFFSCRSALMCKTNWQAKYTNQFTTMIRNYMQKMDVNAVQRFCERIATKFRRTADQGSFFNMHWGFWRMFIIMFMLKNTEFIENINIVFFLYMAEQILIFHWTPVRPLFLILSNVEKRLAVRCSLQRAIYTIDRSADPILRNVT